MAAAQRVAIIGQRYDAAFPGIAVFLWLKWVTLPRRQPSAARQFRRSRSTRAEAGIFGLLGGGRFVFMFGRTNPADGVVGASAQIDVEVVHVAGHVGIIAERRHDVSLR